LDDNGIDEQGCSYVADMLKENYFITDLVKYYAYILLTIHQKLCSFKPKMFPFVF